jgi:hypothetical protein
VLGTSSISRGNYNVCKGRTIKPSWSGPASPIYYTRQSKNTYSVRENVEKLEL